jgi:translation initiation factor IF-1
MPDTTIHTAGPVLERLGPVLYRAALPNGKRVLAHLARTLARAGAEFAPGTVVVMELTPYDFDHARILRAAADSELAEATGDGSPSAG